MIKTTKPILRLVAMSVAILSVDIHAEEKGEAKDARVRYDRPILSLFYETCMTSGGMPGWAKNVSQGNGETIYKGDWMMFEIWTPHTTPPLEFSELDITHRVLSSVGGGRNCNATSDPSIKLEPGESRFLITNQIEVKSLPRGSGGFGAEYCIKARTIDHMCNKQ